MAKVNRVSVDRIHNLGDYEHIKYSVSVDVGEGDDPGKIISRLERLLDALAPLKKPYDVKNAEEFLSNPENASADAEKVTRLRERLAQYERRVARREKALSLLADLGGSWEHKDAKTEWDDDEW